jgi:hypothetical protein
MKDLLKRYIVAWMMTLLLIPGVAGQTSRKPVEEAPPDSSGTQFAIQIAASKLYIDPDFFKQKFNLTDSVRYIQREGWYKYVIGLFKSESEAEKALSTIDFEAFVTAIPVEKDSALTIDYENKQTIKESELRRQYHYKIRQADSAFNITKNLLVARNLYEEAIMIDPGKNYPMDQIVEIDKKLTQEKSKSLFAKLTLKVIVLIIIGFSVLIACLIIFLVFKKRRGKIEESGISEEDLGSPKLPYSGMNRYDPFFYLADLSRPLTPWEQLKVYDILKRDSGKSPDYTEWIKNENISVIIFTIRMIRTFKKVELVPQIFSLTKHPDPDVREEAVIAIGDLGAREVLSDLMTRYAFETSALKVQILKTLAKIPLESNIGFLQSIVESKDDFSLEAAVALFAHETIGIAGLEKLEGAIGADFQDLAKRILNNLD